MKNPLNQRCSCGSGRKARYCCKTTVAAERKLDLNAHQIFRISRKMPKILREFMVDHVPREFVEAAWDDFIGEATVDVDLDQYAPLFFPWVIYNWIPDSPKIMGLPASGYQPAAKVYLQRNASRLAPLEAAFLRSGLDATPSFYKIVAVNPDHTLMFEDIFLSRPGEPLRLTAFDKSLSASAKPNMIFFGLVFETNGIHTIEAAAPLAIPGFFEANLLELRDAIHRAEGDMSAPALKHHQYELLDEYWQIAEKILTPPRLQNTSGEELSFHKLEYECHSAYDTILALADLTRDRNQIRELTQQAADANVEGMEISFPWSSTTDNPALGGRTTFGQITVKGKRLTVRINSAARAARFKKMVEKRLGDKVTLRLDLIESPQMSAVDQPTRRSPPSAPQKLSDLPPEAQEVLRQQATKRKAAWFDTAIPMLGGISPRAAAKSKAGREKLEILIRHYTEQRSGRDPDELTVLMNPQEDEIRRELKI
jgi:hypothetical protein